MLNQLIQSYATHAATIPAQAEDDVMAVLIDEQDALLAAISDAPVTTKGEAIAKLRFVAGWISAINNEGSQPAESDWAVLTRALREFDVVTAVN